MAIKYDLYPNPASEDTRYHARLITGGTVETDTLAQEIQTRCSLTKADVYATLSALGDSLTERLKKGERIHIEGLGYFQITLEYVPGEENRKVRSEQVKFKSVTFRPEQALKKKMADIRLVRVEKKHHSGQYSAQEIDELLKNYFRSHDYITRGDFEQLCQLTKTTANRRLKELTGQEKLKKEGASSCPFYTPLPGWFGK